MPIDFSKNTPGLKGNFYIVLFLQAQKFFLFPLLVLYIALQLSTYDFGVFSLGLAIAQLAIVTVDYGLGQYIILKASVGDQYTLSIANLFALKLSIGFVFLSLVALLLELIYPENLFNFFFFALSGFCFSIFNFFCAYFRAKKQFAMELIGFTISNLVLLFAVFSHEFLHLSITQWVGVFLISRLVPMLYSAFFFVSNGPSELDKPSVGGVFNEARGAFSLALVTFLAFAYLYADMFLTEYFLGYELLAQYQLAFRLMMLAMIFPEVFNHLMLPYLTAWRNQDRTRYLEGIAMSTRILFVYAIVASLFLGWVGPTAVVSVFGEIYTDASELVVFLTPLVILRCVGAPIGLALLIEGLVKTRIVVMASAFLIGVLGNFFVLPRFGLMGAIAVSIAVHILLNVGYYLSLQRRLYAEGIYEKKI